MASLLLMAIVTHGTKPLAIVLDGTIGMVFVCDCRRRSANVMIGTLASGSAVAGPAPPPPPRPRSMTQLVLFRRFIWFIACVFRSCECSKLSRMLTIRLPVGVSGADTIDSAGLVVVSRCKNSSLLLMLLKSVRGTVVRAGVASSPNVRRLLLTMWCHRFMLGCRNTCASCAVGGSSLLFSMSMRGACSVSVGLRCDSCEWFGFATANAQGRGHGRKIVELWLFERDNQSRTKCC